MVNILICGLLAGLAEICGGRVMYAYIDQKNFRGQISFTQATPKAAVTIQADFKSFDPEGKIKNVSWTITKHPVVYDEWCTNAGVELHDFTKRHGNLKKNYRYVDTSITLSGVDSIFGNSVVLFEGDRTNGTIACSTILPHGDDVLYAKAAIFSDRIGGTLDFIQKGSTPGVMIYGNLKDATASKVSFDYGFTISADTTAGKSCDSYYQMYNPTESNGPCDKKQPATCKLGDMTSRFGTMKVGGKKMNHGYFYGVDTHLQLTGPTSIIGHYLVIKDSSTKKVVGCARINIYGPLDTIAIFTASKHKGISGSLKFQQHSPYHHTLITTKLSGLGNRVKSYHVHKFPISSTSNPCGKASVGAHVNTWKVDANASPDAHNGSLDKYEVGDLSGRYGGLNNKTEFSNTARDANLPLYGLYTILGRSIVIHENNGARFVCTNIEPHEYVAKIQAEADFTAVKSNAITGTVRSTQYIQKNGLITRTTMVVDLKYKANATMKTQDHDWDIHSPAIMIKKESTCDGKPSSVYNPVNVNHTEGCGLRHPFCCKMGQTSRKVGKHQIGVKTFYSDINTPLFGEYSALGLSTVFHHKGNNTAVLGCATMVPVPGQKVLKLSFAVEGLAKKDDINGLQNMLMKAFRFPKTEKYRINSVQTFVIQDKNEGYLGNIMKSLYLKPKDKTRCFVVNFYLIETGQLSDASNYICQFNNILASEKSLLPFKKCKTTKPVPKSHAFNFTPSLFVMVLAFVFATLMR